MTKEQIEKAAMQAQDKMTVHFIFDEKFQPTFTDAFAEGAEWRIKSVWHKPTAYGEELKAHVEVIAHCKSGYHLGKFNAVGSCHEYIGFVNISGIEFALSEILEYAYIDDLLPQKKQRNDKGND